MHVDNFMHTHTTLHTRTHQVSLNWMHRYIDHTNTFGMEGEERNGIKGNYK